MLFSKWVRCLHTSRAVLNVAKKSPLAILREQTGFSLANCKKAVSLFPDELNKAEEWLKKQAKAEGWDKINKLQTRVAVHGLVGVARKDHVAAMVEVNCETDFVSRNSNFQELVTTSANILLNHVSQTNLMDNLFSKTVLSKTDLENLETNNPLTPKLSDMVAATVNLIKENILLKRGLILHTRKDFSLACYVHPPSPPQNGVILGKYGAFIIHCSIKEFPEDAEFTFQTVEKNLCQHIIGCNPKALGSMEDKPVENEEDKLVENKEDKPVENEEDKPVEKKEETNLLFQEYLANNEYTVGEYIEEHGIEIIDFTRFECGELVK